MQCDTCKMKYICDALERTGKVPKHEKCRCYTPLRPMISADVAPVRHGHWESLYWAFDYYRCSECGFEQRLEKFPYCPNCGAKMDGDKE